MARTKQTARKSVGGKAPRKYEAQQQRTGFAKPLASKRKRQVEAGEGEASQAPRPEITFTGTYDTAFYAHYFLTGDREKDAEVRCRYAQAHTRDPLTQQEDCWVSLSYNSKLDGIGMKNGGDKGTSNRPALNLVVALDISTSMDDSFRGEDDDEDDGTDFDDENFNYEAYMAGKVTKLKVAKDCLLTLLAQMRDDDAFGLVLFNCRALTLKPLTKWSEIDKEALEESILELETDGGTALTGGFKAATELFAKAEEGANRSSRIFFLTDMEAGSQDELDFIAAVKQNSEASLWSTIVGIGMDLARVTVEETSKTPGCNYATVISSQDFTEMINQEFDYTVTPTGFNATLTVNNADGWRLHSGYGSPEVSCLQPGGQARHSTLFPSTQNEKGETRGGLFLFKLERTEPASPLDTPFTLISKWDNLIGVEQTDTKQLKFQESQIDDPGIRKAVLLVYYTDFIRPYLEVRNKAVGLPSAPTTVAAPMPTRYLSLITPENRVELLTNFIAYFKAEMEAIQDPSLHDELAFLETVRNVEQSYSPNDEPTDKEKEDESEGKEQRGREEEETEDKEGKGEEEDQSVAKRRKSDEGVQQQEKDLAAAHATEEADQMKTDGTEEK